MVPEPTTIPRLARLLALAIKFQAMVERGEVRDYADRARLGNVTRAAQVDHEPAAAGTRFTGATAFRCAER
jgi:hypothetical protein